MTSSSSFHKINTESELIKVYNEDCVEFLKTLPSKHFDLAIVDPPYGINENGQRNVSGDRPTEKWKNPKSVKYHTFDDSKIPDSEYFSELFRVSKNQIVWGGNYFTMHLKPSKGWIVWNKRVDIKEHLSMCELAWTSFDRKLNMFEYLWAGFKKEDQEERIHPTQKPVALYKWILQHYAKPGQLILDTHLGSGSIAIACHDLGYDLTACELSSVYCQDFLTRFQAHITKTPSVDQLSQFFT